MAAVTICSDFGGPPPPNKVSHCFHYFPIYLPLSDGTRFHDLHFWMLSLCLLFHSPLTYIKRLFSSSLLSAIRVVLFTYLRLLIFLPSIFIPACDSSSPEFFMIYFAYKLNKQGDNLFPIWKQSIVPCLVLIAASWPAYRFLRRQARWSGIPISLKIFHCLLWLTQSKTLALSIKWN